MRDVTWIVLDDLKTNLIAALIVLILAANFTKIIDLPFRLSEIDKEQMESGLISLKSTRILVFGAKGGLKLRIGELDHPLEKADSALGDINPELPVIFGVEQGCGLTYEELVGLLGTLKVKGVKYVSLLAELE